MSDLTDQQRETLARLLDEREAQLHGEVRDSRQAATEQEEGQANVPADSGDLAENRRTSDMRHAETERDVDELREIDAARERLADGTYGDCIDCDEPIGFARLQVEPMAPRCIDCQTIYERSHLSVPLVATGQDLS